MTIAAVPIPELQRNREESVYSSGVVVSASAINALLANQHLVQVSEVVCPGPHCRVAPEQLHELRVFERQRRFRVVLPDS